MKKLLLLLLPFIFYLKVGAQTQQTVLSADHIIANQNLTVRGQVIDTISVDGTMSANSNDVIPTQAAIVTYVGHHIGSITSITLTMPTGFTVTPGTLTSSGTFAVTTTLSGVVMANGSGFSAGQVNLVSQVTGYLPVTNIVTSVNADASHFLRGDGTWAVAVGSGTVTSVNLASTTLSFSGGPITGSGVITVNLQASGVTPGTYNSVTVNTDGIITAATIVKDTIHAVGGVSPSVGGDSIYWGGGPNSALFQDVHIDGRNLYNIFFDSTQFYLTGITLIQTLDTTGHKLLVLNQTTHRVEQMTWPLFGGSGSGTITGQGANAQIAVFNSSTNIRGHANFLFDTVLYTFTFGSAIERLNAPTGSFFGGSANIGNGTTTGVYSTSNNNTNVGNYGIYQITNANAGNNTNVGAYGLLSATDGGNNTNIGSSGLLNDTSGSGNVAVGVAGLLNNLSGNNNATVGNQGLFNNKTGSYNTNMGGFGLYNNVTGTYNTNVGYQGDALTNPIEVVSVGYLTLGNATTPGTKDVFIGDYAGYNNALYDSTIVIGYNSGAAPGATNVINTTIIGNLIQTLNSNFADFGRADQRILLGNGGGNTTLMNSFTPLLGQIFFNTDSAAYVMWNNTKWVKWGGISAGVGPGTVGQVAIFNTANTVTSYSTLAFNNTNATLTIGTGLEAHTSYSNYFAGSINIGNSATPTGVYAASGDNVSIGEYAMNNITNANSGNNTNIGAFGLTSLTTGSNNINAGSAGEYYLTTGGNNSNIGTAGLYHNIAGNNNTNFGYQGLYNSKASNNTNIGTFGLYNDTTGAVNTNIGEFGNASYVSNDVVSIGYEVLGNTYSNISNSVIIGDYAGYNNAQYVNDIIIGYNSGKVNGNGASFSNVTIIGHDLETDSTNIALFGRADQRILLGNGGGNTTVMNSFNPIAGQIFYNTDSLAYCMYNSVKWIKWGSGSGGGGGGGINPDLGETITTGTSSTVPSGYNIVQFNESSTIAAYSLTLPLGPHNSNTMYIVFGGTITSGAVITTLTLIPNAGQTLGAISNTFTGFVGENITLHFFNNTWFVVSQ